MKFDLEIVEEFIESSKRSTQIGELNQAIMGSVGRFGYNQIAATVLRDYSVNPEFPNAVVSYPKEWQLRYAKEGYHVIDPAFQRLNTQSTPFFWSACRTPDISRKQSKLFEESLSFGLGEGISVAMPVKNDELACVSFAGTNTEASEGIKHMIHLIATYYHQRLRIIQNRKENKNQTNANLTRRQTEVLRWFAQGKSAWDISIILGVSEATVRFHLAGVRRKYGVNSSVHATSIAIAKNHIRL